MSIPPNLSVAVILAGGMRVTGRPAWEFANMDMYGLVQNGTVGLILIVVLVVALMVLIIRRILRVRKTVADALAEGIKKSKKPEKPEGGQPGGTAKS